MGLVPLKVQSHKRGKTVVNTANGGFKRDFIQTPQTACVIVVSSEGCLMGSIGLMHLVKEYFWDEHN